MWLLRLKQWNRHFVRCAGVVAAAIVWPVDSVSAGQNPAPTEATASFPGRHTPIRDVTFVAFDTETTGFSLAADRIVAINAVKFRDGKILGEVRLLIDPQRDVPHWARRVHDIDAEAISRAPTFPEAYAEFLGFLDGAVLLAHNARFDISFLKEETGRHGLALPENPIIDTLPLFRTWFPDADSYCAVGLALHTRLNHLVFPSPFADSVILQRVFEFGRARQTRADTLGALRRASGRMLYF